ncbi:MAG TPA: lactate permease LctP family transporter [Puia sp.]
MIWKQILDPFPNRLLSVIIALLPVLFIFWALIIKKMKGYQSSLIATIIALFVAIAFYKMPLTLALVSVAHGVLYGLFPICWIFFAAIFLFNITVNSGQFEIIKHCIASITPDRRIQAVLIAFSFGSFLEGTAGFGAPVAITAAMLVELGFEPLYAGGLCLLANTAPVAFGSIGIPITVASQVSDIPEFAIAKIVGRTLPILSFFIPAYLTILLAGFKKAKEIFPAIFVAGFSFAFLQYIVSNFLGATLPDIIAGIGSIVSLSIFLKFWKPKAIWRFDNEKSSVNYSYNKYTGAEIIGAFAPFIFLTLIIITWGLDPVKELLNKSGYTEFKIPLLHNSIMNAGGKLIPQIFKFNYLSAAGTAIFISALISIPTVGIKFSDGIKILVNTIKQLKFPIITVAAILGFAYLMNNSGITLTISKTLTGTGKWFPLFAPLLGWLGVFITGSDTSSNALFGKLQSVTANAIGVDPVVTVGANISGGVVGKMISPQSIAVAAAAGNLVGKESSLFRFTVKHSFIMLAFISCIVFVQAYFLKALIPAYNSTNIKTITVIENHSSGYICLSILAFILISFSIVFFVIGRKKNNKLPEP